MLRRINGLIPRSYKGELTGRVLLQGRPVGDLTLAQTTMEAQRAHGYELERAGGLIKALRNLAPLIVSVTIGAIMRGEDLIDAMDLRAFGTGPRTWLHTLPMIFWDWLLLIFGVGTFVVVSLLNLFVPAFGQLWVPLWLLP